MTDRIIHAAIIDRIVTRHSRPLTAREVTEKLAAERRGGRVASEKVVRRALRDLRDEGKVVIERIERYNHYSAA